MQKIRSNVILQAILLFMVCEFGCKNGNTHNINGKNTDSQVDTISGYFLYESNVPLLCYSRFDQIAQARCLVYYSDSLADKDIAGLYKKGMFFYDAGDSIFNVASKKGLHFKQNYNTIEKFRRLTLPYLYETNSTYKGSLYDSSKTFSYIKVRATIAVQKMGKMQWLIPKASNYKCCFANTKTYADTYLIRDFIDFHVY